MRLHSRSACGRKRAWRRASNVVQSNITGRWVVVGLVLCGVLAGCPEIAVVSAASPDLLLLETRPTVLPRHAVIGRSPATGQFVPVAAKVPRKIVALGDSITRGVRSGVQPNETFAAVVQEELRREGKEVEVVNAGMGGERTDGALARLDRDVLALRPDWVLLMYGTNDSYVDAGKADSRLSRADFAANLRQLVTRLRRADVRPILMTEPCWGLAARPNGVGEHPNGRLAGYMAACREVAREMEVPLIDHFARWSARQSAGMDVGDWTTDQCHPNPAGHRILADEILPEVRRQWRLLEAP